MIQINAGGPSIGTFEADSNFDGGAAYAPAAGVSVSAAGVRDAAPAGVYTSYRYGYQVPFTYLFAGLTPGASYGVRLHFAEIYPQDQAVGRRVFSISTNGVVVEPALDVYARVGGDAALVLTEVLGADSNGQVDVTFQTVSGDSAMLSGIELLQAQGNCPATTSSSSGSTLASSSSSAAGSGSRSTSNSASAASSSTGSTGSPSSVTGTSTGSSSSGSASSTGASSGASTTGGSTGSGNPQVTVLEPKPGATLSASAVVSATVIDTLGSSIVEVDVLVDGAVVARGAPPSPQASSPLEPTWTWNWLDTFAYPDGAHTFAVQAKDAAGNVGSSAPVTATVANACTGVTVQPGTGTLDSALNSNGPNTVFCLMPGTFTLQGTLGLQSGQTLRRAQDGAAVLDGSSSVGVALNGGSLVNNVSIIGLEFQHFFSSHAATNLNPGGAIRESYGTGWTVQANYIHDCLGTGIEVTNDGSSGLVNGSSNSLLVDNRIANMGYSGIKVSQSSTITAEANEISGSNLNGNDPLDDVGSLGKWAVADNCTLIDNYVHDNEPSGIWFDVACYQNEVAHNILANNQIDGVIYEILLGPQCPRQLSSGEWDQ